MHLAIRSSPLVESSAAGLLGEAHPLTRALERRALCRVQTLTVMAVLVASGAAAEIGAGDAVPVALAAAFAGVVSWLRVVGAGARVHGLVLALIADGRGGLPLAEVEEERARLLDPRHRRDQADWLLTLAGGTVPPIVNPRLVAGARCELVKVATALARDERGLAGLALLELVTYEPSSPLFGDDVRELRAVLSRVRFLLSA